MALSQKYLKEAFGNLCPSMEETVKEAILTHIESPKVFYANIISKDNYAFKNSSQEFNTKLKEASKISQRMREHAVGMHVLFISDTDGEFHRGRIEQCGFTSFQIFLIDIGSTLLVDKTGVGNLPDIISLEKFPPQAIKCCLFGSPTRVSKEANNNFIERFKGKNLTLHFIKRESTFWLVSIVEVKDLALPLLVSCENGTSDSILHDEKFPSNLETSNQLCNTLSKNKFEDDFPKETAVALGSLNYFKKNLKELPSQKPLTDGTVLLAHIEKESQKFFIHKKDDLESLMLIQEVLHENINKLRDLESFDPDTLCIAKSLEHGEWYRALIISKDIFGTVVQYVDFGNKEVLLNSALKEMLDSVLKYPKMAYKCCLMNETDFPSLIDYFNLNEAMDARICSSDNETYTMTLKHKGRVLGENSSHDKSSQVPFQATSLSLLSPPLETKLELIISYIERNGRIWVQLSKNLGELSSLMEQLQSKVSPQVVSLDDLVVGSFYCAKFSEDLFWYRCKITSTPSGGKVSVHYVDYGNSEEISIQDLRKLSFEFQTLPIQAIQCCLFQNKDISGVYDLPWLRDAVIEAFLRKTSNTHSYLLVNALFNGKNLIEKIQNELRLPTPASVNDNIQETSNLPSIVENKNLIIPTNMVNSTHHNKNKDECQINESNSNETEVFPKSVPVHYKNGNLCLQVQGLNISIQLPENSRSENDPKAISINDNTIDLENERTGMKNLNELRETDLIFNKQLDFLLTHVEEDGSAWVQQKDSLLDLQELMHSISSFILQNPSPVLTFSVGVSCLAKYDDNQWYRAQITNITDDYVLVHYSDFGNTSPVPKEDQLIALPARFCSLPKQAIHCLVNFPQGMMTSVREKIHYLQEHLYYEFRASLKAGNIPSLYDISFMRK